MLTLLHADLIFLIILVLLILDPSGTRSLLQRGVRACH